MSLPLLLLCDNDAAGDAGMLQQLQSSHTARRTLRCLNKLQGPGSTLAKQGKDGL